MSIYVDSQEDLIFPMVVNEMILGGIWMLAFYLLTSLFS